MNTPEDALDRFLAEMSIIEATPPTAATAGSDDVEIVAEYLQWRSKSDPTAIESMGLDALSDAILWLDSAGDHQFAAMLAMVATARFSRKDRGPERRLWSWMQSWAFINRRSIGRVLRRMAKRAGL